MTITIQNSMIGVNPMVVEVEDSSGAGDWSDASSGFNRLDRCGVGSGVGLIASVGLGVGWTVVVGTGLASVRVGTGVVTIAVGVGVGADVGIGVTGVGKVVEFSSAVSFELKVGIVSEGPGVLPLGLVVTLLFCLMGDKWLGFGNKPANDRLNCSGTTQGWAAIRSPNEAQSPQTGDITTG